jgi:hypothetical protein
VTTHSEVRKRSEQVLVRFTPEEMAEAKALAAAHDMTLPQLLRVALLSVRIAEARYVQPQEIDA